MHFIHIADVHIGAWKHPQLTTLPDENFRYCINYALEKKVDFILIAGDLFDSALPSIEHLKSVVGTLSLARDAQMPVYSIPGSHDYSPSGKTVLGVLEEAGLVVNVFRGKVVEGKLQLEMVIDKNTGTCLAGVLGRKGVLETKHYEELDKEYLKKQMSTSAPNIFLFHTSLNELKPTHLAQMQSSPVSMMPAGFDYYAGGHVHITGEVSLEGYPLVTYPGPVFPASFSELEHLGGGQLIEYIDGSITRIRIPGKEIKAAQVEAKDETPEAFTEKIIDSLGDIKDKIVLLRLTGTLSQGGVHDINHKKLYAAAKDSYVLLKNSVGLRSQEQAKHQETASSAEELEEQILRQHMGSTDNIYEDEELAVMKQLLITLSENRQEGETIHTYEQRILEDGKKVLGLDRT